jgi:hypothetical protein
MPRKSCLLSNMLPVLMHAVLPARGMFLAVQTIQTGAIRTPNNQKERSKRSPNSITKAHRQVAIVVMPLLQVKPS